MGDSAFAMLLEIAVTVLTIFNEKSCAVSIVVDENGTNEEYATVHMTDNSEQKISKAVYDGLLTYLISTSIAASKDSDILLGATSELFGEDVIRAKYAELFMN